MKAVILAGGFGTRISEESHLKPKPMIELGEQPILWHIMKYYSTYGIKEFVILAGYKQNKIKEYFANYFVYNSDITFYMVNNSMEVHRKNAEDWKVTVLDTGLNTMTGGRIKRAAKILGNEPFMLTYGDGVSDVDIDKLLEFHQKHGKVATITTVSLAQQKGILERDVNGEIKSFREKEADDAAIINGGYMVLNPEIFSYIEGDETVFEKEPLRKLAAEGQLMGYEHDGFWQCMDTQREKQMLEELWASGKAPWKRWE
ncbi:MAG: glucose-1-phosphate cytidylyltransferase [Pseudobutyrivibrio ruminis]|uniref:glucose-1-phosphate cytidylyltransferase n=1 Tax=Pseudobutyrivibrio ruminis TaxID=46206 RepID=UPI0026ED5281|nr:glucose-1-phosphate cytidylyltransferase [Pseudobutyrivibrio ruminis]MBE5912905.1 glucose-1-phosphate cytidylyltransferase [Pseudobutyrivibrio ruminis]